MKIFNRRTKFYFLSFLKHDLKASITVFFVALPLCLGISLASGAPVYSGLLAGIIGGLIISFISGSELSVSGPAAGLTAISIAAIHELGSIQIFFLVIGIIWTKSISEKIPFLPGSFIIVVCGILLALLFKYFFPVLQLKPTQFVSIPENVFSQITFPDFHAAFSNSDIWKNAVVI